MGVYFLFDTIGLNNDCSLDKRLIEWKSLKKACVHMLRVKLSNIDMVCQSQYWFKSLTKLNVTIY